MQTATPSRIVRDSLESVLNVARDVMLRVQRQIREAQNRGELREVPTEQVTLRKMARSNITVAPDPEQLEQLDELQRQGDQSSVRL